VESKLKETYASTEWGIQIPDRIIEKMVEKCVDKQGDIIDEAVQRVDMGGLSQRVASAVRFKVGSAVQDRMAGEVGELAAQAAVSASAQLVQKTDAFKTPQKGQQSNETISPADLQNATASVPASPKRGFEELSGGSA